MKKIFLVIFCIMFSLVNILSVCNAEGSTGYQQAYIDMLEDFECGVYDDAYLAAQFVYETAPGYQEIVNYYNYLTALQVYLPQEQYKEAYDIFQALALRKFQKSEGYAAYALGCQYEKDGDYLAALDQFNIAFTNNIDEAYQKIQDNRKKGNENKYNQALALQRQKNYLAAAEVFDTLVNDYPDAREKAKDCYYFAAEEFSREGKYEEAADLFTQLGDYKDSAQKAIQNRAWFSGGSDSNNLGLQMEESTSTSILLKWEDETALGSFDVTYMPAGIETQAITVNQHNTSILLDNLFPNTQYTISVTSPSNTSYYEKSNYWTSQASPVTDYNIRKVTIIPRLLDRISVENLGLDKTISTKNKTESCIELSEAEGYHTPDRKPSETNYDTYVSLFFMADVFTTPPQVNITYMLRMDGKISVGKTKTVQLPEKGYKIISENLTDLMDILYENTGISGSDLTIEVYINEQHLGSKTIPISR